MERVEALYGGDGSLFFECSQIALLIVPTLLPVWHPRVFVGLAGSFCSPLSARDEWTHSSRRFARKARAGILLMTETNVRMCLFTGLKISKNGAHDGTIMHEVGSLDAHHGRGWACIKSCRCGAVRGMGYFAREGYQRTFETWDSTQ